MFNYFEFFFGCSEPCVGAPIDSASDGGLSEASSDGFTLSSPTRTDVSLASFSHHEAELDSQSEREGMRSRYSYSTASAGLGGSMEVEVGSVGTQVSTDRSSLLPTDVPPTPFATAVAPRYVHGNTTVTGHGGQMPNSQNLLSLSATNGPLSATITTEELIALGVVWGVQIPQPTYPPHLPFVRCCYDFNVRKTCGKGSNCYHIHANPADRRKPPILNPPFEVYVERPHFQLFEEMAEHATILSLPCQYGMNCKNPLHRECAIQYRFALAEYNAYFRAFRDYEFQMIQQQLAVTRARRELTDDMIKRARSAHAANFSSPGHHVQKEHHFW